MRALAGFGGFLGFFEFALVLAFGSFTHERHSLLLLRSFVHHRWLRSCLACFVSASFGHAGRPPSSARKSRHVSVASADIADGSLRKTNGSATGPSEQTIQGLYQSERPTRSEGRIGSRPARPVWHSPSHSGRFQGVIVALVSFRTGNRRSFPTEPDSSRVVAQTPSATVEKDTHADK